MRPCAGMRLILYDSASRGNVPFVPADPERVRIYTCGPTVYRYAHIGNLRTYLLTDLLVRTLRFLGYGTFAVQNITDMGHMHQEQLEAGEDKVIAAARAAGKSGREIARFFTEAFFRDCGRMAFLPADAYPRASEHVPEMIALVRALEERGAVYGEGGYLYFDVTKAPGYGIFSGSVLGEGTPAERTDETDPRAQEAPGGFHPLDARRARPGIPVGEPLGAGVAGVAHRVRRHVDQVPWPRVRCPRRRRRPSLSAPRELPGGGDDRDGENGSRPSGCTRRTCWSTGRRCPSPPGTSTRSTISAPAPGPAGKGTPRRISDTTASRSTTRSPMNFTWEGQEAAARARSRLRAAFRRAALQGTSGEDAAAALRAEFRGAISDDLNMPARPRRGPQGGPVGDRRGRGPGARGGVGRGPRRGAALRSGWRSRGDRRPRRRAGGGPSPQSRRWRGSGRPGGGRAITPRRMRCGRRSAPRGTMSWTRRRGPRFSGKCRTTLER